MLKTTAIMTIALMGIIAIIAGCDKKEEVDPEIQKQLQLMDEMKVKRDNRTKELKEMDVPTLINALSAESQRGLEPFNSMAYKETISRKDNALQELSAVLAKKPFFLGLLALREINPDEYKKLQSELRVMSLVETLVNAKFFNAFGVPHLYWEQAANAIIEEGDVAKKYLVPLLTHTREAPVWGSEGTIINSTYKYRVCDYAWKMLLDIEQQDIQIPEDPARRDALIKTYTEINP